MQFTNLLTVALLAVGAVAAPNPAPEAAVQKRTFAWFICEARGGHFDWFRFKCYYDRPDYPDCPYGYEWDDEHHHCAHPPNYPPSCDDGYYWDEHTHNCEDYPPYDEPDCDDGEHGWCSYSADEYTSYNHGHPFCRNDGWNKVWCSDDDNAGDACRSHY